MLCGGALTCRGLAWDEVGLQEGRPAPGAQSLGCFPLAFGPFPEELWVGSGRLGFVSCWGDLPMVGWSSGHQAGDDYRDPTEQGPGQQRAGILDKWRLAGLDEAQTCAVKRVRRLCHEPRFLPGPWADRRPRR